MKKFSMGIILISVIIFVGVAHGSVAKWSQLPSMNPSNGYAFSSENQVSSQVADDFLYRNGAPVTGIRWWGSYWDSTYNGINTYPYRHSGGWGDPGVGTPEIVTGFNISFYQDVPAGSAFPPWGHPGAAAGRGFYIDLADIEVQSFGVIDRSYSTQTVFQYDVVLDVPFDLIAGNIYWISIQAIDQGGAPVQWGWQESSDHWNGNAVHNFMPPLNPNPFLWDLLPGEDMAFELRTVPVPAAVWLFGSGLIGLIGVARRKA